MLSARSFSSGCFIGSVLTPVGVFVAARPSAAFREPGVAAAASAAGGRRRRIVDVLDPLGRAAVALELRFDPVDRRAIAIGALAPIAELRQPLIVALYFSRSSRPTSVWTGSSAGVCAIGKCSRSPAATDTHRC